MPVPRATLSTAAARPGPLRPRGADHGARRRKRARGATGDRAQDQEVRKTDWVSVGPVRITRYPPDGQLLAGPIVASACSHLRVLLGKARPRSAHQKPDLGAFAGQPTAPELPNADGVSYDGRFVRLTSTYPLVPETEDQNGRYHDREPGGAGSDGAPDDSRSDSQRPCTCSLITRLRRESDVTHGRARTATTARMAGNSRAEALLPRHRSSVAPGPTSQFGGLQLRKPPKSTVASR